MVSWIIGISNIFPLAQQVILQIVEVYACQHADLEGCICDVFGFVFDHCKVVKCHQNCHRRLIYPIYIHMARVNFLMIILGNTNDSIYTIRRVPKWIQQRHPDNGGDNHMCGILQLM